LEETGVTLMLCTKFRYFILKISDIHFSYVLDRDMIKTISITHQIDIIPF